MRELPNLCSGVRCSRKRAHHHSASAGDSQRSAMSAILANKVGSGNLEPLLAHHHSSAFSAPLFVANAGEITSSNNSLIVSPLELVAIHHSITDESPLRVESTASVRCKSFRCPCAIAQWIASFWPSRAVGPQGNCFQSIIPVPTACDIHSSTGACPLTDISPKKPVLGANQAKEVAGVGPARRHRSSIVGMSPRAAAASSVAEMSSKSTWNE
ncbi:hypothetical protein BC828DRAFT_376952 [Blastocladiella britannica]|nr:hypothetical protein BC828DRAFT_376952 [Blastocladiella britannica]